MKLVQWYPVLPVDDVLPVEQGWLLPDDFGTLDAEP